MLVRELDSACQGAVTVLDSFSGSGTMALGVKLEIAPGTRFRRLIDPGEIGLILAFVSRGEFVSFMSRGSVFAPTNSIAVLEGGRRKIQFSGRKSEITLLCYSSRSPLLSLAQPSDERPADVAFDTHSEFDSLWELAHSMKVGVDSLDHRMAQVYFQAMRLASSDQAKLCLARVPLAATEPIREVANRVIRQPELEWTTLTGSSVSGYSQHHFSRLFKVQIGVGFHDFVELARTTPAVKMLLDGQGTAEFISREVGFSSANAMRDAIRRHTGLLPSDFSATTLMRH